MAKKRKSQKKASRRIPQRPRTSVKGEQPFRQAVVHHQAGRVAQAELGYRDTLKQAPDHASALHNLALLRLQSGADSEALTLLRRATKADPTDANCWNNLANVLRERGELSEAAQAYEQTLSIAPDHHNARYNLAWALVEVGNHRAASEHFQKILQHTPNDPEAHHGLGVCLAELGERDKAELSLREALALAENNPSAWYDLANLFRDKSEISNAVDAYKRAIAIDPGYAEAHNNLGNCYRDMSKLALARQHLEIVANIRPVVESYCNLAMVLRDLGDAKACKKACEAAVALRPADVELQVLCGELAFDLGDYRGAERAFLSAVGLAPGSAVALSALAKTQLRLERAQESVDTCKRAVEADDTYADAHLILGCALKFLGEHGEAIVHFERAVELDPHFVEAYNNLGLCFADLGDFDAAHASFDAALAWEPDSPEVLSSKLMTRRVTAQERPVVERLEATLASAKMGEEAQLRAHFALGKGYDDLGVFERAFSHYAQGNALKSDRAPFDAPAFCDRVRRIVEIFTPSTFESLAHIGDPSEVPVFVVGMPRSGTTLVESIIASHPSAAGAGELDAIIKYVIGMGKLLGVAEHYPDAVLGLSKDSIGHLTKKYLDTLSAHAPTAARVVDKMPQNFLHLGLIAVMFPNAKVVHCMRNPIDVCLSNFFQLYGYAQNYSYRLSDLALYYKQYQVVMAHWRACLPIKLYELQYEDLVSEQETISRELIAYCGLPWDEQCLKFHQNKRAVQTASHWQVRQPMYKRSSARWKNYESYIGELQSELSTLGCLT